MRRTLFLCLLAVSTSASLLGQTAPAQPPPAAPPKPAPAAPAAPRPAAPRQPVSSRPSTLTLQVTDTSGAPLGDTVVAAVGPVDRGGTTAPDGTLRIQNIRPGNYRLRFVHEGSITLERDVSIRAGDSPTIDIALSTAPPAPEPEPVKVEAPPTKGLPPPGDPKVTPVPLFLEKNFIGGREGRKESSLGCTPTGMATLHQLREAWINHTHDDADEWVYVVAGEGTLRIGSSDQKIQAGTFSLVPHTMTHALIPQGRNPLIVISILSGPACTALTDKDKG